ATRLEGPVAVPAIRIVTPGRQQGGLHGVPFDRKLVLAREMRDAAEVEYENLMQRVLPLGAKNSIIDDLDQDVSRGERLEKRNAHAPPGKALREQHVDGEKWRRRDRGGPQQHADADSGSRQHR